MPFKHSSLLSTALVATAKIKSVDFPSKNFNFSHLSISIDSTTTNLSRFQPTSAPKDGTNTGPDGLVFAFALLHLYIHHLRRIVQGKCVVHPLRENWPPEKKGDPFWKVSSLQVVPFVQLWDYNFQFSTQPSLWTVQPLPLHLPQIFIGILSCLYIKKRAWCFDPDKTMS